MRSERRHEESNCRKSDTIPCRVRRNHPVCGAGGRGSIDDRMDAAANRPIAPKPSISLFPNKSAVDRDCAIDRCQHDVMNLRLGVPSAVLRGITHVVDSTRAKSKPRVPAELVASRSLRVRIRFWRTWLPRIGLTVCSIPNDRCGVVGSLVNTPPASSRSLRQIWTAPPEIPCCQPVSPGCALLNVPMQ